MEIWKNITGFDGAYQVSSYGRVKSLKRNKEIILKSDVSIHQHTQYERITLSKDGKTKRYLVHRLVATEFIPNPQNKPHINHKDNNGLNNHVENLEWCTAKENMLWSSIQGRQDLCRELGIKAASNKAYKANLNKGKILFKERFISLDKKGRRFFYIVKCKYCNNTFKVRTDIVENPPLYIKKNMCKDCFKKALENL